MGWNLMALRVFPLRIVHCRLLYHCCTSQAEHRTCTFCLDACSRTESRSSPLQFWLVLLSRSCSCLFSSTPSRFHHGKIFSCRLSSNDSQSCVIALDQPFPSSPAKASAPFLWLPANVRKNHRPRGFWDERTWRIRMGGQGFLNGIYLGLNLRCLLVVSDLLLQALTAIALVNREATCSR